MLKTLPDFQLFLGNESERLQGIDSWENLARIGSNNLERILQLAQENIYRMMSSNEDVNEMKLIRKGIDFINDQLLPDSVNKPTLPRLRNEMFRKNDNVYIYLGDTPNTIINNDWLIGKVLNVSKAFKKDWKDGKPNSGYFWKVLLETAQYIFPNENKISFSTSEPRVIFDWEFEYLKNPENGEFLEIFSKNAFREWKPLWCIEKDWEVDFSKMNFKNWIYNGSVNV